MTLNETPIRTSRNFLINNIKLENIEIPEKVEEFKNVHIEGIDEVSKNIKSSKLIYGNGNILEQNIKQSANNKIAMNLQNNKNIHITYNFDDDNFNLINQIEIEVNSNINTNIIIEYKSTTTKKCFHNGIIKIIAKENSNVNVIIVNLLNEKTTNFEAMENIIHNNANLQYTIIDIGGKESISNYYSNLIGENSKNDLKTIYLGGENQIKDINYIVELRGEKSFVDIDVQGALKANAKKNFKGTIDFKKGCKKAKGNENEFCMLLSDKAKSIALPMLLCTEDDVEGNHGTASGRVDNEQLFYIMSRGLSYNEAVKLIVRANFNKILEKIKNDKLMNEIISEIDNKLN